LGLAAVSAIAMSTTVFALGGVASAAEDELPYLYFTTDASLVGDPDYAEGAYQLATDGFELDPGYCSIEWTVLGAQGGNSTEFAAENQVGAAGDEVSGSTAAPAGAYSFALGAPGGDAQLDDDGIGVPGTGGTGSTAGGNGATFTGGEDGGEHAGGGGGGATEVTGPEGLSIVAAGGAGGGPEGSAGTAGGVSGFAPTSAELEVTTPGQRWTPGQVTAVAEPCPVLYPPVAPVDLSVVDGSGQAEILFTEDWDDDSTGADTWEYSVDGGTWTEAPADWNIDAQQDSLVVPGLTNGQTYEVRLRGVSETDGPGAASAPVTAAPYTPIGAPTGLAVSTSGTSVTITWAAPTVEGSFPVAGYVVGMGAGESGGVVCETPADVLTCVVTDLFMGTDYSVVVFAVDSAGHDGEASPFVMTGAIPFPASVPAANGSLGTTGFSTGSVDAGQSITVSGSGYMPFSTVSVLVYSTPTLLGTAGADENGAFTFTGTLPAGLAAGTHTLVAAGVDADGNPYYLTQAITVGGSASGGGLAYTGADIAVPAIGGLAALAIGGGLVLAGRRKRASA
jgi:hypothetical protein